MCAAGPKRPEGEGAVEAADQDVPTLAQSVALFIRAATQLKAEKAENVRSCPAPPASQQVTV